MLARIAAVLLIVGLLTACKTPDEPRHPIPAQQLTVPVPEGLTRVVFINTSNRLLYFESGPIRIQLDGQQLPSIWLDHYIQAFIEPGEYELRLEHFDLVFWKGQYRLKVAGPEMFVSVYNIPISTRYEILDSLPEDFHRRYKPGRDPNNW